MSRKLWVFATVTLFGVSAVLTGIGLTRTATACDDTAKKTAAATSSSSCCAKDGTSTASTDAKKVHKSMVKSAVVAPGAAPILNVAAFGAMVAGGADCAPCDWCPGMTTAAVNASSAACVSKMSTVSAGCASKSAATTASYEAIPAGHPAIMTAEAGHPGCGSASAAKVASSEGCGSKASAAKVASSEGCGSKASAAKVASTEGCGSKASAAKVASSEGCAAKNAAAATIAAGGDGCSSKNSTVAAGQVARAGASCCDSKESKSASAAGNSEKCATAKTASLKGKVDEMPYRENKRVVLAGSYACGHCTLDKTEDCTPMLKTADGKVYPLLQNNHAKEMRSREGKDLEVSATVKKVDGVKFLDVKSYKVM